MYVELINYIFIDRILFKSLSQKPDTARTRPKYIFKLYCLQNQYLSQTSGLLQQKTSFI